MHTLILNKWNIQCYNQTTLNLRIRMSDIRSLKLRKFPILGSIVQIAHIYLDFCNISHLFKK